MAVERPMTRSRENTRARLMDAALSVFSEFGLEGASVEMITDRAGFTRGAFYSNFESKIELFLILVKQLADEHFTAVYDMVHSLPLSGETSMDDIFESVLSVTIGTRDVAILMHELQVVALRDSSMVDAFVEYEEGMVERVAELVEFIALRMEVSSKLPIADIARVLLTIWSSAETTAIMRGFDRQQTLEFIRQQTVAVAAALID